MPPANPAAPGRRRATPAGRSAPTGSGPPSGSDSPTGRARRSPLPSASATTAMPPANPAAPGRRRPTPARGSSPTRTGPPAGRRWRSPPLCLSHEVGRFAGQSKLGGDRHRFSGLDETKADGADRCRGNGISCNAKEGAAGGGVHRVLLACYAFFCNFAGAFRATLAPPPSAMTTTAMPPADPAAAAPVYRPG
jgi:hypothetical protein